MTVKRLFLVVLTALALFLMGADLYASYNKPQFQSELSLFETDLRLHTAEWQSTDEATQQLQMIFGQAQPIESALGQYQDAIATAEKGITATQATPRDPAQTIAEGTPSLAQQQRLLEKLKLRFGILQVANGQPDAALKTWESLSQNSQTTALSHTTASTLSGLWRQPPEILPNAEATLKNQLDGWYRFRALERLYEINQRQSALALLKTQEQAIAENTIVKLGITGAISTVAIGGGTLLLLTLGAQRLLRGEKALLAGTQAITWKTPWDWEDIWFVLVVGFFTVGQLVIPTVFGLLQAILRFEPSKLGETARGIYVLATYLALATGGLSVLYLTIRQHFPLPESWFKISLKGKWALWGVGGYLAAFPLVVAVSLVNQQIWQGQGGSNPILPIALQGQDPLAMALFFVTAAIAAPIFEEIFFRGFLLPSLTRYFSTWNAILLSSLIFAIVHLSLSEVLPLMTLGVMLGFVYTRTQNLLASMLLHSLWNSGTLISLFLLGSAGR